jgi:hypothetical protein
MDLETCVKCGKDYPSDTNDQCPECAQDEPQGTVELRQFVLDELDRIRRGIETDRFTMENIWALEAKLRARKTNSGRGIK